MICKLNKLKSKDFVKFIKNIIHFYFLRKFEGIIMKKAF